MKFAKIIVLVAAVVVFSAGFVFADDGVGDIKLTATNQNDLSATGGAANSTAAVGNITDTNTNNNNLSNNNSVVDVNKNVNKNVNNIDNKSNAKSDANSNSNSNAINGGNKVSINYQSTNLPTVGFGSFMAPGNAMDNEGWKDFCPAVYQNLLVEDISNMDKFQASNLLPWNWFGNSDSASVGGRNSNKSEVKTVSCTCYWPKEKAEIGDRVLGGTKIIGEPNKLDEIYMGQAENFCRKEYNSRRVAMRKRTHKDGVTIGASVGGSGMVSKLYDQGNAGTAFVGGGMLGKNRTKVEDYAEFEVLCMNDGPAMCGQPSLPPPPVFIPPPPVVKPEPEACNPEPIREQISLAEECFKNCFDPCQNNVICRKNAADNQARLYVCTGKTDKSLLFKAIENYEAAERDFLTGWEPNPQKTKTRTLPYANKLMKNAYYNWSWVILELYSEDMQTNFANNDKATHAKFSGEKNKYKADRYKLPAVPETIKEFK